MSTDEASSIAVCVLFFLFSFLSVISKLRSGFKLYLLLGLSCLVRSALPLHASLSACSPEASFL